MPKNRNRSLKTNLESIAPSEAARLWKESRIDEVAEATLELQSCHVRQFIEWLSEEGIDDMQEVSAKTIFQFKLDIKPGIKQNTLAQRISTIRRFLYFCVSLDSLDPNVPERIDLPPRNEQARTVTLETEQAQRACHRIVLMILLAGCYKLKSPCTWCTLFLDLLSYDKSEVWHRC
jgi:site-specific recombinase XerC